LIKPATKIARPTKTTSSPETMVERLLDALGVFMPVLGTSSGIDYRAAT
jgi:hypothetical protein